MKSVLTLVAVLFAVCCIESAASAQTVCQPDPHSMKASQLESEISQIDRVLNGQIVRTGWRRYATTYPSAARRQELLARRERLIDSLHARYAMAFVSDAMTQSIVKMPIVSDARMKQHMDRLERIEQLRAGQKGL